MPTVLIGRKKLNVVRSRLESHKFPGVIADFEKHLLRIKRLIRHTHSFSRAQEAMAMAQSGRDTLCNVVIVLEEEP